MQTNYEDLNWFEAATVTVMVIGFVLIGLFMFNSVSEDQQKNISSAFDMFDIHEEIVQPIQTMKFIAYDAPQEVMNQFYIAFTEVASLSSEQVEIFQQMPNKVKLAIYDLLDQSANVAVASTDEGKVLGASIEAMKIVPNCDGQMPQVSNFEYHFDPPKISLPSPRVLMINLSSP